MTAPSPRHLQDAALLVAAVVCAAGAVTSLLGLAVAGPVSTIGSPIVGAAAATVAFLGAARSPGRTGQAWTAIGASVATWAIGDVIWAYHPDDPSTFPLYNAFYLAHYPLLLAGVLRLPAAPWRRGEAIRTALDLAIALLGAAMVVWHELLRPLANQPGVSWQAAAMAAAFPVGDLVLLLALGLLILRRPTAGVRASLSWLSAALTLEVLGDLGYALLGDGQGYGAGDPLDAAWMTGQLAIGVAAWVQRPPAADDAAPSTHLPAATALPYLGIVLGFGLVAELAWLGRASPSLASVVGAAAVLCGLVILRQILAQQELDALTDALQTQNALLRSEQQRSERLLLNILPAPIAARLKAGETGILADQHADVTVLFADLVGFTALASHTPADDVVRLLNDVFTRFDHAAEGHGVEKVKTIGDAYMAVCGVPGPVPDHARRVVRLAQDMLTALAAFNTERGLDLQLRVGVHSGPVVAGVIGEARFSYDLWGDTVNVASRMESHGEPGRVHISDSTRALLGDDVPTTSRGTIEVRGRGPMPTWFVGGDPR